MNNDSYVHQLHLLVEPLECRRLLAGNVNMIINNAGDLILNGDAQNNDIEITLQRDVDSWGGVVNGRNGTMIRFRGNLASQHFFDLANNADPTAPNHATLGDIRISMKGGNDIVEFDDNQSGSNFNYLDIGGKLSVNLGSGDDMMGFDWESSFSTAVVHDTAVIIGGSGDDQIDLFQLDFLDRLEVRTGSATSDSPADGGDQVHISAADVADRMIVRGGAGSTSIQLNHLSTSNDLVVSTASGPDRIRIAHSIIDGDMQIDLGSVNSENGFLISAFDSATLGNARVGGNLTIRGSGGLQSAQLGNTNGQFSVEGITNVSLGGDSDRLILSPDNDAIFGSDFDATLGSGDDSVTVGGGTKFQDDVNLRLGAGNDTIIRSPSAFAGETLFHGGAGFDTYRLTYVIIGGGDGTNLISVEDVISPG